MVPWQNFELQHDHELKRIETTKNVPRTVDRQRRILWTSHELLFTVGTCKDTCVQNQTTKFGRSHTKNSGDNCVDYARNVCPLWDSLVEDNDNKAFVPCSVIYYIQLNVQRMKYTKVPSFMINNILIFLKVEQLYFLVSK